MAEPTIVGTRIRERRMQRGLRQTELAERAGISASYLNLIEHNRRRIGGRILLRLAAVLDVEPSALTQGTEAALIAALRGAASAAPRADRAPAEEFAGRFPGWAQLLADTHRRNTRLERSVKALTDRLAHDPHLAESLHEVLSVVTAIRSTAAILVETPGLEPEWQARFHRNLGEDSRRLAEGAQALVRYLDTAPGSEADIKSPQDELDLFLNAHDWHFPGLEDATQAPEEILAQDGVLTLPASVALARGFLEQYAEDARRMPLDAAAAAIARHGIAPLALAQDLRVDLPAMFRRLATLPDDLTGQVGLAVCDGSGVLLIRRPLDDFALPRMTGACPLWPLFRVAAQPGVPISMRLQQLGRDTRPVQALAATEALGPAEANMPPVLRATMLLLPDIGAGDAALGVGTSCRICPRSDCPARREPNVMQQGF